MAEGSVAMTTHVLIAESLPIVVEGLRALLAPLNCSTAVAASRFALQQSLLRLRPEVVIVDPATLRVPVENLVQLAQSSGGRWVFFVQYLSSNDNEVVAKLKSATVIPKSAPVHSIKRRVSRLLKEVATSPTEPPDFADQALLQTSASALSSRQVEILKLVAMGRTSKEVADALGLSVKTVASHRSHIVSRIGSRHVAVWTRYAVRHGLIPMR